VGSTGDIDLERYLPDASCVDVIVTTRSQSVQHMTSLPAVQVASLDIVEARNLFIQRAGMSDLTPQATKDIDRIVEHLGHFALAVKLAGAYVASNPHMKARLGEYLRQLSTDQNGLLNLLPQRHIDRYEQSIRRSWELSCDAIAAKCPAALNLLSFLAFMDPVRIWPEDFDRGPIRWRPGQFWKDRVPSVPESVDLVWYAAISDQEPKDEVLRVAFATLLDYSLIQWSNADRGYSMHQLVHSWASDRLSESDAHLFSTAMLIMHGDFLSLARGGLDTCPERLASIPDASLSDRHVM
jgi:hypothetical protein